MRFTRINIPSGATINSAYLYLKSGVGTKVTVNSIIRGENADNPPTFTTAEDFDARVRTNASVDWTPPSPWERTGWHISSDIKTVIQEIVDRDGWSSGNALVIFWEDALGWDINDRTVARAYDGLPTDAPKLEITWTPQSIKPTKPLLYEPADGYTLVDNTPYFEWTIGGYAENHRLLIDNDTDFLSPEIDITIVVDNSYTATTELPNDNYKWKVIAQNAFGENESEVWTFLMNVPAPPTAYTPKGPISASPMTVIRITADLKAGSINIENVTATLNIDGAFSFLVGYPENVDMGNFSVGETKTAEWVLATPLAENMYSYNVTWEYEFGSSSSVTSDNAFTDVTSVFVPPPFDIVAAAMFAFPLVLMGIALAFDNPVFASFAGVVFLISGVYFIDTIWLALIFVGIGVYLLITAFLSEEERG